MWLYEIRNKIFNKVYIGQTIKQTVDKRWYNHIRELNKNIHANKNLQNDWNSFGQSSFEFNIIQKCNCTDELDSLEKKFIKEYKIIKKAYNISEGGQSSRVVYYKNWNGLISPEGVIYRDIENMEEFARTYNLDADKLRQVSNGSRYSYMGWTTLRRNKKEHYKTPRGHKMSTESNLKRSESLRKAYTEGRKVAGEHSKKSYSGIISPEGVIYTNIRGLAEFCRRHGLSKSNMSALCSGKIKQYKGWTYNPSTTIQEN